jgi:AAA+ ATPase superfamily predicted ATPase
MLTGFVGRRHELALLGGILAEVRERVGSARPGKCVIVRGRRRIGRSALVEEFIERQRVPSVFCTAEIGFGGEPLREFSDAVRISGLEEAQVFGEAAPGNWAAALRQLAGVLPAGSPSIVVLDELPYLMDPDGAFESVLQRSWDRELSRKQMPPSPQLT